jgi:hypothetical protein
VRDELGKVDQHRLDICGHEDAISRGGQFEHLRIRSSPGNHSNMPLKIDVSFPPTHSAPDVGVQIRVGLKRDLQANFETSSSLALSKGSSISGGSG